MFTAGKILEPKTLVVVLVVVVIIALFIMLIIFLIGLPWWLRGETICLECRRPGFSPWVGKMPWRRKWLPTPVFLPGESHGLRSLLGYSPQGRKESDTTERLHFHFHNYLSQIRVPRRLFTAKQ